MWKGIGIILFLGGIIGVLYNWMEQQKESQKQLQNFLFFLQKALYVMETEKIKVADFLERYTQQTMAQANKKDRVLESILNEIRNRLLTNTYPNGQAVWEEVIYEQKQNFNREVIPILVQAGNGFFGQSREENINYLQKSIKKLEQEQEKLKVKSEQERKVWIPVGTLGSAMLLLLFL